MDETGLLKGAVFTSKYKVIMSEHDSVVNDKKKPFEFSITIEDAKEYGIPAKVILKMILANMSRRYKFLYPSTKNLAEWTGLKPRTVEKEMYKLVSEGWLVKAIDEIGRKGYTKGGHQSGTEIHQLGAELHQSGVNLHQPSRDSYRCGTKVHQSGTAKYTDSVQEIHQIGRTHYIPNNKLNLTKEIKEIQEGLTPQVASLPSPSAHCVSEFSFPVFVPSEVHELITNPPFVSEVAETDFGNLAESARSDDNNHSYAKTLTGAIEQRRGTEMGATAVLVPTTSAPKNNKPKRPSKYINFAEQDFFWPDHWTGRGRQAMQTWVEYKRDTGKAVLLQSYQQVIKNFAGDESGLVLAVDHSIANAYQGLFKPDARQLKNAPEVKSKEDKDKAVSDWYERIQSALEMKD